MENEYGFNEDSHTAILKSKRNALKALLERTKRHSDGFDDLDDAKCQLHGKRKCCRKIARKKKRRSRSAEGPSDHEHKTKSSLANNSGKSRLYEYSSTDDDCIETTNREELKAALNIKLCEQDGAGQNKSTLSQKLHGIKSKNVPVVRRTRTRKKSRKKRRNGELISVHSTKTDYKKTGVQNDVVEILSGNENVDEDEVISLEEQELRLIALKSAVLKKHEERKKRQQVAQSDRPYSPTDSILPTIPIDLEVSKENSLDKDSDSENMNMDISPASTPKSNICQPMDMELASSDSNSKSPVFFSETVNLQTNIPYVNFLYDPTVTMMDQMPIDMNMVSVTGPSMPFCDLPLEPMPPVNTNNKMLPGSAMFTDSIPSAIPTVTQFQIDPIHLTAVDNDLLLAPRGEAEEEYELRAHLIANLKSSSPIPAITSIDELPETKDNINTAIAAVKSGDQEDINHIDLEADCLRSLLLSSIKHKKPVHKQKSSTGKAAKELRKTETTAALLKEIHLPKIASNLKEALKRIKNKTNTSSKTQVTVLKEPSKSTTDAIKVELDDVKNAGDSDSTAGCELLLINNNMSVDNKNVVDDDKEDCIDTFYTVTARDDVGDEIKLRENDLNEISKVTDEKTQVLTNICNNAEIVNTTELIENETVDKVQAAPIQVQPPQKVSEIRSQTPPVTIIPAIEAKKAILTSPAVANIAQKRVAPKILTKTKPVVPVKKPRILQTPSPNTVIDLPKPASPASTLQTTQVLSRKILVPELRPVQKLIISLNQSDSSSSSYSTCEDDDDDDNNENNSIGMDIEQTYDNKSPTSIAMDSPSYAPSSPAPTIVPSSANNMEIEDDTSNQFQKKLDEYLKSVRAKTAAQDQTPIEAPKRIVPTKISAPKQKTPLVCLHSISVFFYLIILSAFIYISSLFAICRCQLN